MSLNIDQITFSYGPGEFRYDAQINEPVTGIFGHSGSGKSTLLNLICGILTPTSGRIVLNGTTLFDSRTNINLPANRRRLGVVFQKHYVFPHLNVKQNLYYSHPGNGSGVKRFSPDEVIEILSLGDMLAKKPFQLSGGELQRVAIGRSLISQPEMLLLDEPFNNLDLERRDRVTGFLLRICEEFMMPMLIISHDLEDLLKLTDTLLLIQDRRTVGIRKVRDREFRLAI